MRTVVDVPAGHPAAVGDFLIDQARPRAVRARLARLEAAPSLHSSRALHEAVRRRSAAASLQLPHGGNGGTGGAAAAAATTTVAAGGAAAPAVSAARGTRGPFSTSPSASRRSSAPPVGANAAGGRARAPQRRVGSGPSAPGCWDRQADPSGPSSERAHSCSTFVSLL